MALRRPRYLHAACSLGCMFWPVYAPLPCVMPSSRRHFFLIQIATCHFQLTVAIYERKPNQPPRLLDQVSKRVYASPSSTRMCKKSHSYTNSYPKIHFTVDDFDVIFSDLTVPPVLMLHLPRTLVPLWCWLRVQWCAFGLWDWRGQSVVQRV